MLLYEVRVQLRDIKPPIWRVLRVRPQTSLPRLHKILQKAMGWTNSHLHLFEIDGKPWGEGDFEWDFDVQDYRGVRLNQIFKEGRKSFLYEYDLGDSWRHDIMLLGTVEGADGEKIALRSPGPVPARRKTAVELVDITTCWKLWPILRMKTTICSWSGWEAGSTRRPLTLKRLTVP